MTAVIEKPDTAVVTDDLPAEEKATVTVTDPPAELIEFTVGTGEEPVVIKAVDEAEAMRKYKRLVRAQALNAQIEQGWCTSGTNERLVRLGVRKIGEGVSIRVEATVKRTVYVKVDADSKDEALAMVASGEEDVLATVKTHVGREFEIVSIALPEEPEGVRLYVQGEPDETWMETTGGVQGCEDNDGGYYCTRARGHDGNHAGGHGRGSTIGHVWG